MFDLFVPIHDLFIFWRLVFPFITFHHNKRTLIWHKCDAWFLKVIDSTSFSQTLYVQQCKTNVLFVLQSQLLKAAGNAPKNCHKSFSLTSECFLDTVTKCESISLPESPSKWIIWVAKSSVAAVLVWFSVQLRVMCWKDEWLCNRRNFSWTASTPG